MCWSKTIDTVRPSFNDEILTADKDIYVLKIGYKNKIDFQILDSEFISLHVHKKYIAEKDNERIELIPSIDDGKFWIINKAYHSFSYRNIVYISTSYGIVSKISVRFQGVINHILDEVIINQDNYRPLAIGLFVIPKGTRYVENPSGEIASENIKFIRNIENAEWKHSRTIVETNSVGFYSIGINDIINK